MEGYHDFLERILMLGHEDHRETLDWAGGSFDMERFGPKEVRFEDPQKRWEAVSQDS